MRVHVVKKMNLEDAPVVAWSIVKDELDLLPAFLNHHRLLGIRHFIFHDDGSIDGTLEYLLEQQDCMVLKSDFKFGDPINGRRGVNLLRWAIPRLFLQGRWGFQLDADEFAILPMTANFNLPFLCRIMDEAHIDCCWANLVDTYPANFYGGVRERLFRDFGLLKSSAKPSAGVSLFASSPRIFKVPLVKWSPDKN